MIKNWKANNARRVDFPASTLLQIPKSKWGYLRKIKMFGDTTQIQTEQGKNLFDKAKATMGYYLNSAGTPVANAAAYYTGYIRVAESTQYVGATIATSSSRYIVFYDASKNIISTAGTSSFWIAASTIRFTTPAGTRYVRVSGASEEGGSTINTFQLELGASPTPYVSFVPNSPSPQYPAPINNVPSELDITSCGGNLYNGEKSATNQRIAISFGGTYPSSGYVVSEYIAIISSTEYTLSTGQQSYIAWYDENKLFISGGSWNNQTSKISPTNAKFLRFDYPSENLVQLELGSTASSYTPYRGTTTTIALKDTEGNYHTPKSLPAGTRDEVDLDGGESVERVRRLVVTSGTSPYGFTFYSISDTVAALHFSDTANPFGYVSTNLSRRCNIAKPIGYGVAGGFGCDGRVYDTQISLFILKSKITDAGFTLDNTGAQSYIDKIIADNDGQPIIFDYPLATPKPWTLHPDEIKKIITVDSDTAYVYTNAEVQPELSVNVISYGDDET